MRKPRQGAAPQRTQQERSALAQNKLRQAAIALIHQNGFSRLTMNDIAKHAGMTRGAIQHHFGDRVGLYRSILEAVEQAWVTSFQAAAPERHGDIGERIDTLLDNLWHVIQTPAYYAVIDIYMSSRCDAALRASVKSTFDNSTALYASLWLKIFSPEVSQEKIEESRELFSTFCQGAVITGVFRDNPGQLPPSAHQLFGAIKNLIRNNMLAG